MTLSKAVFALPRTPANPPACSKNDANLIAFHAVANVPTTVAKAETTPRLFLNQSETTFKTSAVAFTTSANSLNDPITTPPITWATLAISPAKFPANHSINGLKLSFQRCITTSIILPSASPMLSVAGLTYAS